VITSRIWRAFSLCVLALCSGSGCAAKVVATETVGSIENIWTEDPPASEQIMPGLDEVALFDRVADRLEARFVLPRDLPVLHLACGTADSFYDPNPGRIRMCDEYLAKIVEVTRTDPKLSEDDVLARVHGKWVLIFLHEVGHAFIDFFDIPVLGEEESVVDNFAALLLVNAGEADMAELAFDYWLEADPGEYDAEDLADEHDLKLQRYYSGLCIVYGSDPSAHGDIVDKGLLSADRAERCPSEYRALLRDWKAVLGPRLIDPPE
jgi:hypothetical protein